MRRAWMVVGVSLSLFLVRPVPAEEVVVKNDSITDLGQATIVGDFAPGEQAGARLTSPCAGTIVAVQVLWLEGTPGHMQSLEQAIHIYNGATFPTPGTELALLEGPVMTPGVWNEFRYLDEAQQIPVNVPVTSGQQFYVTLELANATDVGSGGPSVVRDNNGCQTGKNVLYGDIGAGTHWYNMCLLYSGTGGDFAIRAVINCPAATGACCHPDGTCTSGVEQAACIAEFGATWTQGQTCAQVSCAHRGACCRAGGCLQLVSPANCAAIAGVYAGDGANCNDNVCSTGACCFADGSCTALFGFQCTTQGGTFHGVGTTCSPNPCPQPTGACCFGTFCIDDQTSAQCTGAGGAWAGAATTCVDGNSNGVPDACDTGPVICHGDCDCDGRVAFSDIDYFVAAIPDDEANWRSLYATRHGGAQPTCSFQNCDITGDGHVNFADIDPFVALIPSACP